MWLLALRLEEVHRHSFENLCLKHVLEQGQEEENVKVPRAAEVPKLAQTQTHGRRGVQSGQVGRRLRVPGKEQPSHRLLTPELSPERPSVDGWPRVQHHVANEGVGLCEGWPYLGVT